MVEQAGAPPSEAETSLADSRAQFVGSLGRRLEALRQALFALEQAPKSAALRDHLRRRIHAFGAAAGVLGFDRVFEAFREAEAVLGRTTATSLGPNELGLVARTVDLVPSLVLGAAAPVARREAVGPQGGERRGAGWPTSVLVFGGPSLADPLEWGPAGSETAVLEMERAEDAARAEEIVRITAPDVAVIDADRKGARELMETLVYDPLLDPVRIIAVGTFDRPEAAASLVALGVARVLPKPVSPDTLRRAVLEVAKERAAPAERVDPIGDVTVEALGERIAHEVRRGLVDAVKAQSRGAPVALGAGTDVLAAVWSAVARIRELVTLRSGGMVRFDASGPEGAVPLAPWMTDERTRTPGAGEGRSSEGVSLTGRTIIVVDDDPAVVWFISGLLRAGGAEVIEAHDGAFALDLARKCSPDVIVSDILMPGLDGFALCREIKRDVALSDVPVILLSWKEDLLQRVRELGADAEGYLRKEATGSTVVQRVREVLLPRARIEARLAEKGAARGRLDGLTPRLVLDLVCKKTVDARLTVRDAAYLYEVDVREGRVRTATRTSADGRFERNARALSALLGVRAGRFSVTPDTSPCQTAWDLPLDELISEHVERARAAQRALANPSRVAQVEIEEGALEPYLAATPLSAAAIVRRLAEGVPPGDIVATGASPRLLESVLVDLVLHGAIRRISGFDGKDLLAAELASLAERRASVEIPAAKDFRTPGPPGIHSPELHAPSPLSSAVASIRIREAPAIQDATPGFDDWEVPASSIAASRPGGPEELFAMLGDSVLPPAPVEERPESMRVSMKGLAPPTSAPAEPSPLETALRSLPAGVSSRSWKDEEPASEPAPEAPVVEDAPVVQHEPKEAAVEEVVPAADEVVPAAEEFAPPIATLPAARHGSTGSPPQGSSPGAVAHAIISVAGVPMIGAPSITVIDLINDAGATTAVSPVMPPIEPIVEAAPSERAPSAAAEEVVPDGSGDAPPASPPKVESPKSDAPKEDLTKTLEAADNVKVPDVELGDAVATAVAGPITRESEGLAPLRPVPRTTPPTGKGALPTRRSTPGSTPAVPARGGEGTNSFLGIVGVMVIAAVATYALVTAVRNAMNDSPKPALSAVPSVIVSAEAPVPSVASAPAPVSSSTPTSTASPSLRVEELDLPAGLTVSQDRGLLEVEVDASQSVYVDGVFIGRGAVRQVPLREGAHEIRIQGEGLDMAQTINLHRGKRTHIEMTRAP